LNDIHLIKEGDKVGSSESALLQMLDIRPFEYGLKVTVVYDQGALYSVKVLDLNDSDILAEFGRGLSNVAGLALALNYPTLASFPHVVLNGYKRLLSIALSTDYVFDQAKSLKELLENPEALKAATQAASSAPAKTGTAPAQTGAAPAVEEKEESEELEFDIFG